MVAVVAFNLIQGRSRKDVFQRALKCYHVKGTIEEVWTITTVNMFKAGSKCKIETACCFVNEDTPIVRMKTTTGYIGV